MKKYIKAIFLLIVAIIPLILPSISIQIEAYEGEDALTAYAYELRLVRYEKQGDTPEYVGGRILIYNPEIFADIKAVSLGGGGDIPQSYDDFYSRSFSSISYIDASSNDNIFTAAINQQYGVQFLNTITYTDGFGGADDILTSALYTSTFGEQAIPQNVTAETTSSDTLSYGQFTCGYELYPYVSFYGKKSKDPATGQTKENFKMYYYYSDEKRGNYYGKDVIALDDNGNQITYNDMIPDSDLTQYNVENNGYVDTLLRRYGDSIPKIQQYFGYTIGDTEIHKYYVEAVPVVRVLEQNTSKSLASRAYLAHTYSKSEGEIYTWGPNDWQKDTPHCESGSLGGDGMCHKTECQCPAGVSCNDSCESCTQTYRDPCQTSCSTGISYGTCIAGWSFPPKIGSYCRYTDESCTSHLADVTSIPEERFKLELLDPAYYKFTIKHLIYGTEYDLPSYLVTAQYVGAYLNRAVNTCSNNQHCIYQENTDICTDQYEYYVGPNKENALVGLEAYNPYTLAGCPGANGATYGRQHIYLANVINERCINGVLCCRTEVCSNILAQYGDRSDEYLACSENFCEATVDFDRKGNARNLKRSCILNYCGYSYGIDPDDPGNLRSANRQSVDSCANSPIAKKYASNPLNSESACNKSGDDPMQNKKGTNAEKCVGDSVTDFNMDISLDTVFEQRSYINKVCRDEVGFEYTDLSEVKLPVAGTGFSYPIIESGNRNCTYFINLEQWKFDYATVPARDPLNRKRMLYILDMYNQETNSEKKGNKKASPYYDAAFETAFAGDLEKYGKTYYEAEGFDFSNTEISVNITEKVIDKTSTTNHPQNMLILATDKVENGEYAINNSISAFKSVIAMRLKSKVQIGSINEATRDAVTIVEKGQIVGKKDVERYETQAKGSITYGLEKSCMSTDGQSVVTKTTNNICGTNANGEPIYADNKFYTSFNIKTNYLNPVNTKATVAVTSSENGTVEYYNNLETCNYKVKTSPDKTSDCPDCPGVNEEGICWLVLEKTEDGKQIKSNEIEGNSVKVKLRYDIPQKKTSSGIIDNGVKTDLEEITIRRNASKSVDEHKLKGEVTYKGIDGAMHTVTCPNEIALEKQGGTCLNVSCEIIKNNEKEYEIKTTGAIVKYSYFTSQVKEFDLAKKYTTNITPRIDGRVIVGLSEALGSEDYIHGYVETSNPRCNAHCRYPSNDGGGGNSDRLNCYEIFDPIEVEDIYNYCHKDENIEKDINNFIDGDDCYKKCSAMCQNDKCDIEAATKYCEKWEEIGFPSKNMCMTTCSRDCPETEEDIPKTNQNPYLFRTVSVLNPFPSSQESEYPYEKGNRKVGSNWRYLSEYITNDEDDTTTVTGQNSLNNQVEYIIDLTPADIKRIREDTASLGANNGNNEKRKRAVYAKLDRVKTSSKAVTAYKSNFLHNSEFTKIFKPNHESTVSTFTP